MMDKKQSDGREGVAVVIVLGMLALLMIMGVAFSVSMRVERRSAGNYSHSVATKDLVWAGMARAMDRIEDEMQGYVFSAGDSSDKPAEDKPYVIWRSIDPNSVGSQVYVNLCRGEATDYVPWGVADAAFYKGSDWMNFSVKWRDGHTTVTNLPGRFAYLILDVSDSIDCNHIGITNRMAGISAKELQLGRIIDSATLKDFVDEHDYDMSYDTIQEQMVLSQVTNDYFGVYSRYPVGAVDEAKTLYTNLLYIGQDVADIKNAGFETAFKNQMEAMLYKDEGTHPSKDRLDYIYNALIDYIDEDDIPQDLELPCTEAVPMINEVQILDKSGIGNRDGSNYLLRAGVDIETFYPFVRPSTNLFSVTGSVQVVIDVRNPNKRIATNVIFDLDSKYAEHGPTGLGTNIYKIADGTDRKFAVPFSAGTNSRFKVTMTVKGLGVVLKNSKAVVDSTEKAEFKFAFAEIGPIAPKKSRRFTMLPSYEAIDPRFNWLQMFFRETTDPALHTLRKINSQMRLVMSRPGFDDSPEMYVANRGHLLSVGELGNLVQDRNPGKGILQTFRLFDQGPKNRHHPFRYFTVSSNSVVRGSVNLNTPNAKILATAFDEMPLLYPENDSQRIKPADVNRIVDMIINKKWAAGKKDELLKGYENVADIVDLDWSGISCAKTDFEREALLSYSYGLLGTRQNLFVVIVAASPVTTQMGKFASHTKEVAAMGSKRAIAYIWRDPFPDANGHHKCFVQFFKWLK